jgi:hypothetical protein
MDPNTPIEDLDLTVRAYNGLKRREIHTLGDLFGCLDRGIECALPFAKMGHRTAESILVLAREMGYPVRDCILRHLILLRRNPETGERELRFWEEMAERIQRVVPNTPEELAKQMLAVTPERIFQAMESVKLDTVYFLRGKEAEA